MKPPGAADAWRVLREAETTGAFFQAWLECLASLSGEVTEAVLVWADAANVGPFRPVALWPADTAPGQELAALCERALALRLPLSQSSGGHARAFPLMAGDDLLGVLALGTREAGGEALARRVEWGAGWLLEQAARSAPASGQAQEGFLLTLDLLTRIIEGEAARAVAQSVVTEAAQRLGCERVSLGFGKTRGVRLFALSHAADFSRRIDLASALEAAMDECADQGETIRLGGSGDAAGRLLMVREHQRLMREYDTQALLSVPFTADHASGVFLFEWSTLPEDEEVLRIAAALVPVVGLALAEKRRTGRPWPLRLGDAAAREWRRLAGPRHMARKLGLLSAAALAAFLIVAEGEFRVAAPASLEGEVRRVVAAPFDSFVGTSHYRAGQVVQAGAELARLDDRDLRLETARLESQKTQYTKQAHEAQAQHNLAQLQVSLAQRRQAAAQRELTGAMLERVRIRAPFDGVIVSGDLSQQLGAAVKKGQVLFEIAPLDRYRVILEVEEVDIPHVRLGQRGELLLAAMPTRPLPFQISLVTPVAVAKEGRNFFRVEARLAEHGGQLRPGMEGVAKISVGTRALAWIWTRRFVDWARLQTWIWLGL